MSSSSGTSTSTATCERTPLTQTSPARLSTLQDDAEASTKPSILSQCFVLFDLDGTLVGVADKGACTPHAHEQGSKNAAATGPSAQASAASGAASFETSLVQEGCGPQRIALPDGTQVVVRDGARALLATAFSVAKGVAFWTASTAGRAEAIVRALLPPGCEPMCIWSRESCEVFHNGRHWCTRKRLEKLLQTSPLALRCGMTPKNTLHIDDDVSACMGHAQNVLLVPTFVNPPMSMAITISMSADAAHCPTQKEIEKQKQKQKQNQAQKPDVTLLRLAAALSHTPWPRSADVRKASTLTWRDWPAARKFHKSPAALTTAPAPTYSHLSPTTSTSSLESLADYSAAAPTEETKAEERVLESTLDAIVRVSKHAHGHDHGYSSHTHAQQSGEKRRRSSVGQSAQHPHPQPRCGTLHKKNPHLQLRPHPHHASLVLCNT